MERDISPNLTQPGSYFEAVNGRILSNDSQTAFSFSNEKGNSLFVELPNIVNTGTSFTINDKNGTLLYSQPYTLSSELSSLPNISTAKIIAFTEIRERLIVISQQSTYYQFWEYDENNSRLNLLYYNNFNAVVNTDLIIQTRYESDDIQKIYFTNSNGFYHLNIYSGNTLSESINTPFNLLNVFPDADLKTPTLDSMLPGGNFKAGSVQYAYNLYTLSGAETKISSFSDVFYVSNRYLGLNEIQSSSQAFKINISGNFENFDVINIYRIFYNSATGLPEVSLIIEDQLEGDTYSFVDDNNLEESDSTLANILFLGSDEFKPKDFKTKDNILFPANIEYKDYDPSFDARAYAFNDSSQALITDATLGNITVTALDQDIPETHDCINPSVKAEVGDANYNVYRYQFDGVTLGVEGPNVKIGFVTNEREPYNGAVTSITPNQNSYANNFSITNAFGNMSFKRDETYRFFIRFKNKKGQFSFSKWIADVRMPSYVENGFTLSNKDSTYVKVFDLGISVTVSNIPSDAVSWEILRETRSESDKTIKAQGLLNSTLVIPTGLDYENKITPNPFIRGYHDDTRAGVNSPLEFLDGLGKSIANNRTNSPSTNGRIDNLGEINDNNASSYQIVDYVLDFYSPEILDKRYQFRTSETDYINLIGGLLLDDSIKFSQRQANTKTGSSPATSFESLTIGQNNSVVNRAFHEWNSSEGQVFSPGASLSNSPDVFYINSYIVAAFTHDCNSIKKVNIQGDSKFIPKSSDRGSKLYTWNAGISNTSSTLDNSSLVFKDSNNNNFDYGAHVNDRLCFNIGQYSDGNTSGLGALLTDGGADNNLVMNRTSKPKLILADYKQVIQNQYGGNTYEARQLNTPVVISDSVSSATSTRVIYGGDIYLSLWNFMRQQMYQGYYRRTTSRENIIIPIETTINLDLRHDEEEYINMGKYQTTFGDYELPIDAYSRQKSYPISSVKPILYRPQLKFDNRVLASDVKINGEQKDSWLKFRENQYIDVDGTHGPINALQEDRDQLFAFQPEGICQLVINPNVQITNGIALELGKGGLLYDYQYLTTSSGTINQYSVIKTPYGIMYYDALNSKLNILNGSENPISDIKGMNSYFRTNVNFSLIEADNPNGLKGIVGYYDHETKETHLSFLQSGDSFEIVYSHLNEAFHYFYNFTSNQYINNRNNVYSLDSTQRSIYKHKVGNFGQYYGEYKNSSITFIVNPSHLNSVFDTLQFNSNVKISGVDQFLNGVTHIRVFNEHQDTGLVAIDSKRKFREWKVNIPREQNSRNRIMSQYIYVTLMFDNANNSSFNLQNVIVNFRPQTTDFQ